MKVSDLSTGSGGLVFQPSVGRHSATVILMHGLGDSAEGLRDLPQMWSKDLSHVKFILPTAGTLPVTLNMGHRMNAWYDIIGLDDRVKDPCTGLEESRQYIQELMEKEVNNGIPHSRIMLAGFSQGGAVALYTGLQLVTPASSPLAGLVILSAYLPKYETFQLSESAKFTVPVLHCHGLVDPVVRHDWAVKTRAKLLADGLPEAHYQLKSYANLGHSISVEVLTQAALFLKDRLPSGAQYYVANRPKQPKLCSVKELKEGIREAGISSSKIVGLMEKSEFVKVLENYYEEQGISCREEETDGC